MAPDATPSTGWPEPFPAMGTPDPALLQKAAANLESLDGPHPDWSDFVRDQLGLNLTRIVNQAIGIEGEQIEPVTVKTETFSSSSVHYIEYHDLEGTAPMSMQDSMHGVINQAMMTASIARYAARYRQTVAYRRLAELIPTGSSATRSGNDRFSDSIEHCIRHQYGAGLKPCHPAAMLLDLNLVDAEFTRTYDPKLLQGIPARDWVIPPEEGISIANHQQHSGYPFAAPPERTSHLTRLTLNLNLPLSMAESLSNTPLHRLVALPEAVLDKVPSHARDAWLECMIDHVKIRSEDDSQRGMEYLYLKPTRQICWAADSRPHDHIPSSSAEQALVNLAMTGEIV